MSDYAQPITADPENEPSGEESGLESPTVRGPLLDEPNDKKVAKAVLKNWTAQDEGLSYQLCEVEQAEYWRAGERFVFIRPAASDLSFEIWRPLGVDRLPAMPDKVDEKVRQVVSQMTVDPMKLEAIPIDGEEQAEQHAELATRIFEVEGAESGWNLRLMLEGALDISSTQKSAFAHVWKDPNGGGRQPVTVMAHAAVTAYDPSQPALATIDPATGRPTADLVTKYLQADGSLSAIETAETQRRWVPKVRTKLLGVRHGRFLPQWSRGFSDAEGFLLADYVSIGDLKQRFPETVGQMAEPDLKKLTGWAPFSDYELFPEFVSDPKDIGTRLDKDVTPDDAMALVLWEYHRSSPVYPKGADICVGGGEFVLGKGDLEVMIERPDGSEVPEILDIPVSQCRCLNDWVGNSPLGVALVTKLGPWGELMTQQWTAVQEWLERWNHPHQYLPMGSIVQPGQMETRSAQAIMLNPDGQPFTENVPAIPSDMKEWYDRAEDGLNNAANMRDAGQLMDSSNTQSGISKQVVLEQVAVALSNIKQNAEDFMVRLGRLLLQRLRAYTTIPQTIRYVGDDAAYRVDEWSRADLYGAKDVRLVRGSFSLLTPQAKREMVMTLANPQFPLIGFEQAQDMLTTDITAQAGLEDDPVRIRIKRQIDAFMTQSAPFEPLPVDDIPEIAKHRFRELSKAMMSTRFAKVPLPAKQLLFAEFEKARVAAGIPTVADQQAQQQQMVAQQQQAAQQQAQQEAQGQQQQMAAKQMDAGMKMDMMREKAAVEVEQAAAMKDMGLDEPRIDSLEPSRNP